MKFPKVFAVVPVAAALLLAGLAPLFGGSAAAAEATGGGMAFPHVTVEAQGESTPAQSLDELLGVPGTLPGAKGTTPVSAWTIDHDVSVDHPTYVNSNEKIYLGGHTLTVYGDLTLYGALDINGGKLIIKKASIDSANITGNLIIKGGLLIMQKSADYVEAKSVIADGGNETGALSAGSIRVNGQFLQLNDYSPYSYNETGSHATVFAGANKLAIFTSPIHSGILNLSMTSGTTFTSADMDVPVIWTYAGSGGFMKQSYTYHTTGGTFLSLKKNLTANYSIAVPNLYYMGTQGTWSLAVSGNLIIPQGETLNVTGNISANHVYAAGTVNLNAGSIVTGSFNAAQGGISAVAGPGTNVTISKFTSSDLAIGGTPTDSSVKNTTESFSGDIGARSLTLANPTSAVPNSMAISTGAALTVGGGLTVSPGHTLAVGAGRLLVSGGMDVKGLLDMQDAAGFAQVGGTFTAEGSDSSGHLTNGTLILEGSFVQAGNANAFRPGPGHTEMLFGPSVKFHDAATPGSTEGSWFGSLINCNLDIDKGAYFASSETDSSTKLTDITASADVGVAAVYPSFSKDTLHYEIAVPQGAHTVTLSGALSFPNQTVVTRVDGSTIPGDSGTNVFTVDPTTTRTVTLQVLSSVGLPYAGAGAPFCTTYTVLLQPQNPDLASPGMPYSMDKPFDADTLAYAVTVPAGNDAFTFTPVLANPNASFQFSCGGARSAGPTFTRAIAPGNGNDVEVDVEVSAYTNPNVSIPVTKTYKFTFHRQSLLDNISVTAGGPVGIAPVFDRSINAYSADVPASVYAVTVTPGKGDGCASCKINGVQQNFIVLNPPIGGSATATVELADSTGSYLKTYTVAVSRAPLLSGISVTADAGGGSIKNDLAFSSVDLSYIVDIPANSTQATITGLKVSGSLAVNGNPDEYTFSVSPGNEYRDIPLVASAGPDQNQQATYHVTVRTHLLADLGLSAGAALSAPFSPDPAITSAVTMPYTSPSVTLMPVENNSGATHVSFMYYDGTDTTGTPLPSGTVALSQGQTRLISIVASYSGFSETYKVNITRALSNNPNLSAIGASTGWLSPAFSASSTAYTLTIPETVAAVTLRPATQEPNSTYKIDSLALNTARTVTLSLNGSAKATVVVTAAQGDKKTYTVTVRRLPMVQSISAQPVYAGYPSLSPGGTNRMTLSYSLSQPATVKIEVKNGTKWLSVLSRAESSPGAKSFSWDGKLGGVALASGTYSLRVTPYCAGKAGTAKTLTVKILPKPAVTITTLAPVTFTARGTARLKAAVKWTRLTDVRVDVVNSAGAVVKTLYQAANRAPSSATLYWDGKNSAGALVAAGQYRLKVTCGGAAPVYKAFTLKR